MSKTPKPKPEVFDDEPTMADMICDGYFDCETGEVFDDIINGAPAPGHPRSMRDESRRPRLVKCPHCNKHTRGLAQHMKDKHGGAH